MLYILVSTSQHVHVYIILTFSIYLSYTELRLVIFEYKCMHVVFEYKCMHLSTNKNIFGDMPKTVDFNL